MEEEYQQNLKRAETLWKCRLAESLDELERNKGFLNNWQENLMALDALKTLARIRQLAPVRMPRPEAQG